MSRFTSLFSLVALPLLLAGCDMIYTVKLDDTGDTGGDDGVIDVLVVYSQDAADTVDGQHGFDATAHVAADRIASANQAMEDSELDTRLALAGVFVVSASEQELLDINALDDHRHDSVELVVALRDRTDASLHRQAMEADVVMFLTTAFGGAGYITRGDRSYDYLQAYNMEPFDDAEDFIGGIGTFLGANNEVAHVASDPAYRRPHVNCAASVATVMYEQLGACVVLDKALQFANPNVSIDGVPSGVENSADNACVVERLTPYVALFSEYDAGWQSYDGSFALDSTCPR